MYLFSVLALVFIMVGVWALNMCYDDFFGPILVLMVVASAAWYMD